MQTISRSHFTTVKSEGGILPADLLQRIAEGRGIEGMTPESYHLAPTEKLNEAINRAWNRCLGAWVAFNEQRRRLAPSETGTTLTRERWLLVLFQELGYGRLQAARGVEAQGTSYPVSHLWGQLPIHLVTFQQPLDRRSELQTRVKRSPHSLVQELLNRSEAFLWGMVSNGLQLRILRDNVSMSRAAFVEFDLEAMMSGELYADFALLWLLCHQSRVEGEEPQKFWLERWSQQAQEQGTRALDALRQGVQEAISALGRGFLAHPANRSLRQQLKSGELGTPLFYRQLLRLVYRLIFLFVAEDRGLLLRPDAPTEARQRYLDHYAVGRLRALAEAWRGSPHPDRYQALRLLFDLLREGYQPLGLPALGSLLFSARATPALDGAELSNQALLDAIRALVFTIDESVRRPVDFRNLGAEELGSVYESLLELHPQLNPDAATFALESAAGSERKTSGSYYTPASLITSLLDRALEPVVKERLEAARRAGKPLEEALLEIKVVDPACGSGHFLIAAAHRLATHVARVRTGDDEPAPEEQRAALRDVVRSCIHGVDLNEMAVELCKVALWMETLDPGKPLSFLDMNIQHGNSLVGVGPGMEIEKIPDVAFQPIGDDDRATATALRRRNKEEGSGEEAGQFKIRWEVTVIESLDDLSRWRRERMARLEAMPEEEALQVAEKAAAYEAMLNADEYVRGRLERDLWVSAFFWPIPEGDAERMLAPTQQELIQLRDPKVSLNRELVRRVEQIAEENHFFHWELAFPTVFDREEGGFDVVLGNPPWERIKLQEKEWFASQRPDIANAPNAAHRRRMIEALAEDDPALYAAFRADGRRAEAEGHFARNSGRFPLCGRGDINTYTIFAETSRVLQGERGRVGIIVPSGIATDDTTKFFFQDLMEQRSLVSLYDFENAAPLFPGVHRSYKFCLLTLTGVANPAAEAEFIFFAHSIDDLNDETRRLRLTAEDIALLNPESKTCPVLRTNRDLLLLRQIYVDSTTLEDDWQGYYIRLIHMGDHAEHIVSAEELDSALSASETEKDLGRNEYLRLYEAKLIHHFDHRFATFHGISQEEAYRGTARSLKRSEYANPCFILEPRYWVKQRFFGSVRPLTDGG